MTAKLTEAQRAARHAATLRGKQIEAKSPYHHTPVPPRDLKRCPHCNQPCYSAAGEHPQCSNSAAESRRWEEGRPPDLPAGGRDEEAGDGE